MYVYIYIKINSSICLAFVLVCKLLKWTAFMLQYIIGYLQLPYKQIHINLNCLSISLSIIYTSGLLVLPFMESSVQTIMCLYSFSLVRKLYKSSLQIVHSTSNILNLWADL